MKNQLQEITIDKKIFSVKINRKKIKNTYIRINDDIEIVVNTNYFTTIKQIKELILNNQNKILKMVNNKKNQILEDNQMAYLGEIYEMNMIKHNRFSYTINKQEMTFLTPYNKEETINVFYQKQAKLILPDRFKTCYEHFINYYKIPYPQLSIRKMKSRYGTCYYRKNKVNLNTFLIKYDKQTIDYVIFHELCHFIHQDHSKNFYDILGKIVPIHKELRQNLNKYK